MSVVAVLYSFLSQLIKIGNSIGFISIPSVCNNGSRVCNVNGSLQCIHDIDRDGVEDEQVNHLKYSYTCKQKAV